MFNKFDMSTPNENPLPHEFTQTLTYSYRDVLVLISDNCEM